MKSLHCCLILLLLYTNVTAQQTNDRFISFSAAPGAISLYWKDANGQPLKSLQNLKHFVEAQGKTLQFAMNAGMYQTDNAPLGLYIENGVTKHKLNKRSGSSGNFYLMPNGVFYITKDNKAVVCTTPEFETTTRIRYATQSGPMLLIDGAIHPAFKEGSANLNIRNGVGILADGRVLFAMSKDMVNFFDFAQFFLSMGCKNALYLDGFVSRAYLPSQNWSELDGNFGVMVGIAE